MIRDDTLARALYEQICALPTVDAHEHLHSEEMRVSRQVDIFLLFHQYLCTQLVSAGMAPAKADALAEEGVPLDQKWESLAPYLDRVRTCACARPPFEALRFFYAEEDLTAENYASLSERMQARNRPGFFDRCLREACGIVLVLNQNRTMWQNDLFKPILPEESFIGARTREAVEALARETGEEVPLSLPGLIGLVERLLARRVEEGMVGVKGMCFPEPPGDAAAAARAYERILAGSAEGADGTVLTDLLRDRLYAACGDLGIVVVKHSGVWSGGWSDHTTIRPTNLVPVALRHRGTRFDLFHAGTPWPEDAGIMARALPNVWLNLCWSHLLSPVQSVRALDMWLDIAPVNRYIAFGGDYWWPVENVYGALMQAREIVAKVLARRVREEGLSEAKALCIARLLFHDNPREVYRV